MREIKKTDYKIVISENTPNKVLETFISMKFDTECTETTPDLMNIMIFSQNDVKSWSHVIKNIEVRKETRTYMESATFETSETTVTISFLIHCLSEIQ